MASRYFATVRRAISIESFDKSAAMCWSLWGFRGSSEAIMMRIFSFTLSLATSSPVPLLRPLWKKNFELKEPLGGVYVLICCGSTHRGFMHVDVFSDIAKHHGF